MYRGLNTVCYIKLLYFDAGLFYYIMHVFHYNMPCLLQTVCIDAEKVFMFLQAEILRFRRLARNL